MDQLRHSRKFIPTYELIEQAKEDAEKAAKQLEKIEIAKEMKRNSIDDELISKITNLPLEEVRSLRVRKKG